MLFRDELHRGPFHERYHEIYALPDEVIVAVIKGFVKKKDNI